METPELLKTAIAELDVNLEEELHRYQYWRKHGRAPSTALKFSQRSKPRPAPQEPVLPPPPPEPLPIVQPVIEPEITELVAEPIPRPGLKSEPEVQEPQEPWLDWQTIFASIVIMVVLGTVGYIGAELLNLDRVLHKTPDLTPSPPPPPQSQKNQPPVAINPSPPKDPVSVRPPLPDPTIENLPPVELAPPLDDIPSPEVEQDQPIVVYKVVVDRQYLDRVQQIEPGAFIRPADGVVQVSAFANVEDAKRLIESLLEKDIPAQLE